MIVAGNLERAGRLAAGNDPMKAALANAMEGVDRAAKLTQQLLAYSRRQPLVPSSQNLNDVASGTSDLLRRTLGPEYDLVLDLAPDLPTVVVDRSQTENVILNLAINARDAMPEGGRLSIRTWAQGPEVFLAVSDTGTGISEEIRDRIFEPFFTTKPVGRGTGLGLSQVYGFIKQSGGDIAVDSAPGRGTTVTLKLPREAATRNT